MTRSPCLSKACSKLQVHPIHHNAVMLIQTSRRARELDHQIEANPGAICCLPSELR